MSDPNHKPDLDENINVAKAHGKLVSGPASREKTIVSDGKEPISIWAICTCAIALLAAGGILGSVQGWFDYGQVFQPDYIRKPAPGTEDAGPATKEAMLAYSARGQKIFSAKCQGCHGADGKGDGANYPSLAGSTFVTGETERFAMIILNGIQGPTSTGKSYPSPMPPQGIGMSPEDLAGIMTYLRNSLGNSTGDIVTVDMAKAAIDISGKRAKVGQQVTSQEVNAEHAKNLPGDPLAPKVMVDPATLLPVAVDPAK